MRVKKLDDFRWIAAALVVAIHTSPLESINGTADFLLTRVLARVAVPFFFMVTGYFVLSKATQENSIRRVLNCVGKTGLWYLALTVLYSPIQLYKIIGGEKLTAGQLLGDIFLEGTYYHLWYLPALMIGILVAYGALKLGRRWGAVMVSALYVLGLLGDSYYGIMKNIPVLSNLYEDGWFQISGYTRNGLFFAPLFLFLGFYMAQRSEEIRTAKSGIFLRNAIICMLFMGVEAMALHTNDLQKHDSMYLILPILMLYLFSYLLAQPAEGKTGIFYLKGPMLVYFLHPLTILVLRAFVKITKLDFLLKVSPVYYVAVFVGTVILTWMCLWVWQRIPFRKIRR